MSRPANCARATRTVARIAAGVLVSASVAGCGLADPYADPRPSQAPRLHTPRPPRVPVACRDSAGLPACVAAAYAAAEGNYSASNYPRQHRRMVALSAAALRDELTRTPARVIAAGLRDTRTTAVTAVLATTTERRTSDGATVVVAVRQIVLSGSERGRAGPDYLYYRADLSRSDDTGWRVAAFEALR